MIKIKRIDSYFIKLAFFNKMIVTLNKCTTIDFSGTQFYLHKAMQIIIGIFNYMRSNLTV